MNKSMILSIAGLILTVVAGIANSIANDAKMEELIEQKIRERDIITEE